jgi:hypothetical protein
VRAAVSRVDAALQNQIDAGRPPSSSARAGVAVGKPRR